MLKETHEDLVFEFTRDPALLQQYNRLYAAEFRAVQNAEHYHHVEDEHDKRADFLIVRQGNFCIGGGRLSTKSPCQPHPLPVESNGFKVEDYLPHLGQKEITYGQAGRICLLPDFRGGDVTTRIIWHINRKAVALGWELMVATAPLLNARNNTKLCRRIGLDTKIYFDIPVPPYPMCEGIKMYFMTINVNQSLVDSRTEPMKNPRHNF